MEMKKDGYGFDSSLYKKKYVNFCDFMVCGSFSFMSFLLEHV